MKRFVVGAKGCLARDLSPNIPVDFAKFSLHICRLALAILLSYCLLNRF